MKTFKSVSTKAECYFKLPKKEYEIHFLFYVCLLQIPLCGHVHIFWGFFAVVFALFALQNAGCLNINFWTSKEGEGRTWRKKGGYSLSFCYTWYKPLLHVTPFCCLAIWRLLENTDTLHGEYFINYLHSMLCTVLFFENYSVLHTNLQDFKITSWVLEVISL